MTPETTVASYPACGGSSGRHLKREKYLEWRISKKIGKAIADYRMLEEGDKIAVGIGGQAAELALLKMLCDRRSFVPIRYDVLAVYLDPGERRGIKESWNRFFEKDHCSLVIKKSAGVSQGRGREQRIVWEAARRAGCTKVACAETKDDFAEAMLENFLFDADPVSLKPVERIKGEKLSLIRPLVYVEKDDLAQWARFHDFKMISSSVSSSRRGAIKNIMNELEQSCPAVKTNILKSLSRVKTDYLC